MQCSTLVTRWIVISNASVKLFASRRTYLTSFYCLDKWICVRNSIQHFVCMFTMPTALSFLNFSLYVAITFFWKLCWTIKYHNVATSYVQHAVRFEGKSSLRCRKMSWDTSSWWHHVRLRWISMRHIGLSL